MLRVRNRGGDAEGEAHRQGCVGPYLPPLFPPFPMIRCMQGSDGGMTVPGLRVEPVTNGGDVAVLIGRGKVRV